MLGKVLPLDHHLPYIFRVRLLIGSGLQVATSVLELQERLPLARVVYCSATGVSEVGNMAYM